MSMKRKKKATAAEAVGFWTCVPFFFLSFSRYLTWRGYYRLGEREWGEKPLKDRRMDIIIMQMQRPMEPNIMGLRRPKRSEKKVG